MVLNPFEINAFLLQWFDKYVTLNRIYLFHFFIYKKERTQYFKIENRSFPLVISDISLLSMHK